MSLPFEIEKKIPLIQRQVEKAGAELVDISFKRMGSRSVLTVTADKPGGISLDDCALISRDLGELFDSFSEDEGIHGSYLLEVVSPGLDRPLKTPKDFQKAVGQTLKVTFQRENSDMATWTAAAEGADEKAVFLRLKDGKQVAIEYARILKAVREIQWNVKKH